MARKKKGELPSGSVRILKDIGTGPDGKRIRKSFTGATRAEAEHKYMQWLLRAPEPERRPSLAVSAAVSRYIEAKAEVLSPSTIADYHGLFRRYIEGSELGRLMLTELTVTDVQLWISDLSADHSPKTVRNAHALLRSAVSMFYPDFVFRSTLPAKRKPDLYCPSDQDVRKLLGCVQDPELERAILLAAFGPLRRSEICALTSDDVKDGTVTVSKALVVNQRGDWEVKQPKTFGSYRTVTMPDFVLEKLKGISGRIVTCSPDALTARFRKALARSGCPHFRFHDLRHYSASIMHAIGVPDQYIMSRGGWSSDNVMKRVYRNVINVEERKQTRRITDHFEKLAHVYHDAPKKVSKA